jgi:predicted DNA-binding transcriptional regulator YafY
MNNTQRIYKITNLLQTKGVVSKSTFLAELEISDATFKRDLDYMRYTLNAPVSYDHYEKGYKFEKQGIGPRFELPGLWFSQEELTALITMQQLLSSLDQGGLIGEHIAPLITKIDTILLANSETAPKEIRKRVRIIPMTWRKTSSKFFAEIGSALVNRQRLSILFYSKSTDKVTTREISPQTLIHYRENWYLDAHCHMRNELRSFSLDGIQNVSLLSKKCLEVSNKKIDEYFKKSYGIFSGKTNKTARIKFSPEATRWVSKESWHPNQRAMYDKCGNYILEFEYSRDPELIMDILKYGSKVEVLAPIELRKKVATELNSGSALYK